MVRVVRIFITFYTNSSQIINFVLCKHKKTYELSATGTFAIFEVVFIKNIVTHRQNITQMTKRGPFISPNLISFSHPKNDTL